MLHRMLRTSYIPLISCSHISQPRSAGESSSSYSVAEHYLTGWHLACVGVLKVVLVDSLDRLPISSCPSMQHLLMMSLSSACNNNISCIMHTYACYFPFLPLFLLLSVPTSPALQFNNAILHFRPCGL